MSYIEMRLFDLSFGIPFAIWLVKATPMIINQPISAQKKRYTSNEFKSYVDV